MSLGMYVGIWHGQWRSHCSQTCTDRFIESQAPISGLAPVHGSLETFGGPQRHAIAHLKAGKMVIPNMSSVMLGKSVLF